MKNTQSDVALKLEMLLRNNTALLGWMVVCILNETQGGYHSAHDVEVDSFEISHNGEKSAGGSYYVKDNHLFLASVTPQKDLGSLDNFSDIRYNLTNIS